MCRPLKGPRAHGTNQHSTGETKETNRIEVKKVNFAEKHRKKSTAPNNKNHFKDVALITFADDVSLKLSTHPHNAI